MGKSTVSRALTDMGIPVRPRRIMSRRRPSSSDAEDAEDAEDADAAKARGTRRRRARAP
jgi:hypothetical protein